MAYITQTDLELRLSAPKVLAIYDDDGTGINTAAVQAVCTAASQLVDGTIARSYKGTMPMPSAPPVLCKEAALLYGMALSIERHPESAARYGDEYLTRMRREADRLCERIASGLVVLTDAQPALTPGPNLTGGLVFADGPRLIGTNPDGTSNTGDF